MPGTAAAAAAPPWPHCPRAWSLARRSAAILSLWRWYLRFVHHVSYRRLGRLLLELFGLGISEGALDAAFQRGKPCFGAATAAVLARLRRARVVCSDETGIRVDGRGCWNWVFQNDEVVVHVVRRSRGAGVVAEVMAGHRPTIWVSDLYSARQGHATEWQIRLAHQLRDCRYVV